MEDPSEEYWENEDYSQPYESNGKLGWIWRKGLCLGKKIVVTGVVMSSAPIILPPLVAISTFGSAFLLPAGFAFVTYACTEKLINTLVPKPSPPPALEYGEMLSDEEEYKVDRYDVDKGYGEYDDMEKEEREFEDDTRKEVEMRIELVDEDGEDVEMYRRKKVDEIVEEEGYEEDVGEYMEDEKQHLNSKEISEILEGIREVEDEISLMEGGKDDIPKDSLRAVVVSAEIGGEGDANVEEVLEELAFVAPQDVKEENGHTETFTGINEEEMRKETTGLIAEMRDENEEYQKKQLNEGKREIPVKDMTETKEDRSLFVIPEDVKPVEDVSGVTNGLSSDDISYSISSVGEIPKGDESAVMEVGPKSFVAKELVVRVKAVDDHHATTDVRQGMGADEKRGTLVLSDADVREMADESGFYLLDHASMGPDQIAESVKKCPQGQEPSVENGADVNVDHQEVRTESNGPAHKRAKAAMDQDTAVGSDKVALDEVKIWEQIHAMRTIVGYRDDPQSSCAEELKALYVFTGVEPPASSKDYADLVDVNEKLHFLMSIVGVKTA